MYCLDTSEEWKNIHPNDLWIYNKLILSARLGYLSGPAGVDVPHSGSYIVRPCMNLLGMSRFARIEYLEKSTEHLHPAEFWCEIFDGEHLSVDFYKKTPKLVVRGIRNSSDPLYKWKKWEKIDKNVIFPEILENLIGDYDWINCEFIGNHLIEVHFRQNPDFRYGNSVAVPIWEGEIVKNDQNYQYVDDLDFKRKGFLVK